MVHDVGIYHQASIQFRRSTFLGQLFGKTSGRLTIQYLTSKKSIQHITGNSLQTIFQCIQIQLS